MVCRVEVIGGPAAVKNAKRILSALERKVDGETVHPDWAGRMLSEVGYTPVSQRWNPYVFGATSCIKFHGEKLPPLEHQIIKAKKWAERNFRGNCKDIIDKLDKLV